MVTQQLSLITSQSRPIAPEPPQLPVRLASRVGVDLPRKPRAFLFDVYGTLFVSASGEVGAALGTESPPSRDGTSFQRAFEIATGTAIPAHLAAEAEQWYRKEIVTSHADSHAAGVRCPEVNVVDIWSRVLRRVEARVAPHGPIDVPRLAIAWEVVTNPVWPMPNARQTIETLRAAVPLGIVSNAQFYTPLLFPSLLGGSLEAMGFAAELTVFSFRERRAKPDPGLFERPLASLRERGIDSCETVYVGNDMRNDVLCAKQAGCMTVLFAGDRRSFRPRMDDPDARQLLPDAVITALDQLVAMA